MSQARLIVCGKFSRVREREKEYLFVGWNASRREIFDTLIGSNDSEE